MDFTLKAYQEYLKALIKNDFKFLRFDQYIAPTSSFEKVCLVRHDVDRKPINALKMAKIEHHLGVVSTYYFRIKANTLKPNIIKEISELGHEIGYHYESLSDTNGQIDEAVKDFEKHLKILREIAPIKTCSMHGRPLKPFDNRDIWKIKDNHNYLTGKLDMLGELYLDIDYKDIAYINDTGRNWTSGKSNRRDKVDSDIKADFSGKAELLNYLNQDPHHKIVFQIHPERWSDNKVEWLMQNTKDRMINLAKVMISLIK